jgi:hypothetical protein
MRELVIVSSADFDQPFTGSREKHLLPLHCLLVSNGDNTKCIPSVVIVWFVLSLDEKEFRKNI